MKQKLILIVSVAIGLLAAFITHSYLSAKDDEVAKWKRDFDAKHVKYDVVAAKRDLPSGTVLTLQDIGGIKMIKDGYEGHTVKAEDVMMLVGRKTIRGVKEGSAIFWADVEGGDPNSSGLARDVKSRMRALSVNVSGSGSVSGMVKPNDHVDVLGTFSFPSKTVQGEMELVTLTMMQNVLVLATGRETAKTLPMSGNRSNASYNMVTLEVSPREAEMLVFAEQIKGRISLALRNPDDIYYEEKLPRVDFQMIQDEIETLNAQRQKNLLRK
ncbi:MAG: Flp pilus assembly protein CpaB [Kiritimatiellae bacterium]|nr:Flp pilus assembly protein CpaB [Kiritimatiellia bacterium]